MAECSACTFINDASSASCEICGNAIGTVDTNAVWLCTACTFENEAGNFSCIICATSKGDYQPICETCHQAPANPPFASCCRDCAMGQHCSCSAIKRIKSTNNSQLPSPPIIITSSQHTASMPLHPAKYQAASTPSSSSTAASESSSEYLTSVEMVDIFSISGHNSRQLETFDRDQLTTVLGRLHKHILADRRETARAAQATSYSWEWEIGYNGWSPLDTVDQITVESERRRGEPRAVFTSKTGERVELDFASNTAHFSMSRRKVNVRALLCNDTSQSKQIKSSTPVDQGQCEVCLCESAVCASSLCRHASACEDCLMGHVRSRIETDPAAWVPCPAVGCEEPLDTDYLITALIADEENNPWRVPIHYLSKQLVRMPEWVACTGNKQASSTTGGGGGGGEKCLGGVLVSKFNQGKNVACPICTCDIMAVRQEEQEDEEIAKMKADGTIRSCPACRHPTMKEYGVCNVICCEVCGIWWNWRTNETGKSSNELKQRARSRGSLWEPGELSFQQTLQHSDPAAFKALLERNGVTYDPNYHRGT